MTKVCLIDGSGYIFRAFYALPNMTSPDGIPVNAVYGFVTMFMRLLKNIPCDYCVVLFDAKRQNFRNEYLPEYKANRAETPELLIPQFDLIHEAVEVMNLPYVLQEGFEADDLIATYAKQATNMGMETVIVSGDKDLMQLISSQVSYYDGMKDKYFADKDVVEKFGVTPDKVVQVQALAGDKIDNIPGVPGIGMKTAAELINSYGSIEGIYQNLPTIKQNKRRQLLEENRQSAEISLKLVTLKNDVPVEHTLEEFKCHAPNPETLLKFIDRLGFKSIRPKLEKWAQERCRELGESTPPLTALPLNQSTYKKIETRKDLETLYQQILQNQQISFQILANSQEISGISLCTQSNEGYYLPLPQQNDHSDLFAYNNSLNTELDYSTILKFMQSVLENPAVLKIAIQLKTQWHILNRIFEKRLSLWPYDDIAVMSYDLDSSEHEHTLPVLSDLFLQRPISLPVTDAKTKIIDYNSDSNKNYAYQSAQHILSLHQTLSQRLFSEHKKYIYEMLDRRLIEILMQMEDEGIIIDNNALTDLQQEFDQQLLSLENEIHQLAGEQFNIASPKQVGDILFKKMGLKGKKHTSGSYNTGADTLEKLAEENEIAAKILEWRAYAKLQSTYTNSLLKVRDIHNRVHTTFSQTVVNTGRLASSDPNLQNIPNRTIIGQKIRSCFVARPGYKLVSADYSQMELRLMASVANVAALKEAFAAGVDIHAATAARVFNLAPDNVDKEHRSRAKAINFGIIYGISQFGLARQLNISRDEAQRYIDSYFKIMPEIKEYMAETINFAHRNGYVETPLGRKCYIAGINDHNQRISSFAERAAINAPIQGGAADIVKLAMQQVNRFLQENELPAKLLLQVHDELILEVREDRAEEVAQNLKRIMENVVELAVPMIVEVGIGDNWHSAH